jgi:GMP synthase (glutamine-hydrolysing)
MTTERPLLVVRHVLWEGPHRILRAFEDVDVVTLDVLENAEPLPAPDAVRGAVFMGGPMSVNDVDRHPRLAEEIAWLGGAIEGGLPVLGVCLGSQLIARALGATVRPSRVKELGFATVDVLDDGDPVVGALPRGATVLHWHGEVFDLPPGANLLARSAFAEVQAFRDRRAWGLLFHAEADAALVEAWLQEPTMAREAHAALGDGYADELRRGAEQMPAASGDAVFAAFARQCQERS